MLGYKESAPIRKVLLLSYPRTDEIERPLEAAGVEVHTIVGLHHNIGPRVAAQLPALCHTKWDAIVVMSWTTHALVALMLRPILRAPVVLRLNADPWAMQEDRLSAPTGWHRRLPVRPWMRFGSAMTSRVDAILPICRYLTKVLRERLPGLAVPVMPVPLSLPTLPDEPTNDRWTPHGQRLVVTLTNFKYWTKVEPLLEACLAIHRVLERHNAQWVIGGRGLYLECFQQRLAELSARRVQTPGFIADIWPLLFSADAMVHLSRLEAGPRVALEARAASCPVIVNDFASMPEMVEHERTGLIVDGPEAAAHALDRLLSDGALAARLGAQGREYVLRHHNNAVIGQQLVEAIQSCPGRASHARPSPLGPRPVQRKT